MSRHQASSIVASILILAACRVPQASQVKVYEQDQFLGQNICELMKNEAFEQARKDAVDPKPLYLEIVQRESLIFNDLVPKAQACVQKRQAAAQAAQQPATSPETPTQPATTTAEPSSEPITEPLQTDTPTSTFDAPVSGSDPVAFELQDGAPLAASADVKSDPIGPECDGLDEAKLSAYEQKQRDIGSCQKLAEADIPDDLKRGQSSTCRDLAGRLPVWIDSSCNVASSALAAGGKAGIGEACDWLATIIKGSATDATTVCSSEVVKSMCAEWGGMGVDAAVLSDDAQRTDRNGAGGAVIGSANMNLFVNTTRACLAAVGAEKVKELAAAGISQGIGRTAWSAVANSSSGDSNKTKLVKAIAAAACKITTDTLANQVDEKPKARLDACADEVFTFDRHQAASCLRTTGQACEIALTGKIDLASLAGVNESETNKMIADIASVGLQAVCSAGGNGTAAACGTIFAATTYIKDALISGASNPWADCLGTAKYGACLGQYLWSQSSGVTIDDLTAAPGRLQPVANSAYFEQDVCWCASQCYEDGTFSDTKIDGSYINKLYLDRNANICNSKEQSVSPGLPFTHNGYSIYETTADCSIVKARSKKPFYSDGSSSYSTGIVIEVNSGEGWRQVQFGGPYCGGVAKLK